MHEDGAYQRPVSNTGAVFVGVNPCRCLADYVMHTCCLTACPASPAGMAGSSACSGGCQVALLPVLASRLCAHTPPAPVCQGQSQAPVPRHPSRVQLTGLELTRTTQLTCSTDWLAGWLTD